WVVYSPVEGAAESHVSIIHEKDTMRIDLPEDARPLIDRAWRRGERDTPEVVRFRKGHYAMEQLVDGSWSVAVANAMAKRLIMQDDAAYKQQLADQAEYYRDLPPPAPPSVPYIPPPPMTQEEWEEELARQPGLKEVQVDRVHADTVWVRITGRVML